MKRKFFLILFTIMSCNVSQNDERTELEGAIERFNTAFAQSQTQVLEGMLTTNYRRTNSSKKAIDKQNWLSYISKRNKQITAGDLQILEYTMDELEIQMYHNSAHVTKTLRNDTIIENQYRVTHLWVIENGEWKRAGFHDGKIN